MNIAPERGEVMQSSKEKALRLEPEGLKKYRNPLVARNSASSSQIQAFTAPKVKLRSGRIVSGRLVLATTTNDDPKARERRKTAGARAGLILSQMRKWIAHQGLRHPAPDDQEAYFEVAVSCYIAIGASRPRWSLGLRGWIKRYAPDLYRTRSAEWIDARVADQRREERYFTPQMIGAQLRVTREAFFRCGLYDMVPADLAVDELKQVRRARKADWQRTNNIAKGKVSRPHAESDARRKPWEGLGISQSTYKRMKKRGEI